MQGNKDSLEMTPPLLAMDIGGTFIKAGLWNGREMKEMPAVPVDSQAGRKEVLGALCKVVSKALDLGDVNGVGCCIPGPFDYARNVSLMKHKFASIEGLDLAAELRSLMPPIRGVPVGFCHDAVAFLSGEIHFGGASACKRVMGVTLGTGIGVAVAFDGAMQLNALGSPAPEASIWSKPYRGGTVEDHVSAKALIARYRQRRNGFDVSRGVAGIAEDARAGDREALSVFNELGQDLGELLPAHARNLGIERVVIGGQIAKAFELFGPCLLSSNESDLDIKPSSLGERGVLLGAITQLREGMKGG